MKHFIAIITLLSTCFMTAQQSQTPSVDVTGEGIVTVIPDQVTVNIRVENTGNDAKEVKLKNDQTISDVFQFLKKQKIDEKYIKTEYIRLNKTYEYNTKRYNYTANQSISLKIVDLDDYESIMNGLIETGINRIDGIHFSSSKQASLESEARTKAIQNAKQKAEEYTAVLDQKIGKAMQISEFQATHTPGPMFRSAMLMENDASGQTMAPGEMEIKVRVNVRFELY
ncbi:SIMPL domain-containing protein [Aureisphaera galaxeae]|uniref:SIMPL domain-containing protein n=1 Tax=Aureisphaera galaxeae TaxID=1538023 RepID=UPI00234FBED0|nr:SIMPL domain-containing protein [Aureisphaera galaxeae]MDC8004608.1 SIMPL domain-containing protein [Aureisphaera galaxeae]